MSFTRNSRPVFTHLRQWESAKSVFICVGHCWKYSLSLSPQKVPSIKLNLQGCAVIDSKQNLNFRLILHTYERLMRHMLLIHHKLKSIGNEIKTAESLLYVALFAHES